MNTLFFSRLKTSMRMRLPSTAAFVVMLSLLSCKSLSPPDDKTDAAFEGAALNAEIERIVKETQVTPAFNQRTIRKKNSVWVSVPWEHIEGLESDSLGAALGAWKKSCAASKTALPELCAEVAVMEHATVEQQRQWLKARLQPYQIQSHSGKTTGILTSYYEPLLKGRRLPSKEFSIPLYQVPDVLSGQRWYSRRQIETHKPAMAALKGKEILYLRSPIDALILHIQGSGKVLVREPDGSVQICRIAYAATNQHPYGSVAHGLLRSGAISSGSWGAIHSWADKSSSEAVQKALWRNPRYVFFKEEALENGSETLGPKGAQGVPLTARHSIAVDPTSIPYGTPVWLSSKGDNHTIQSLVIAQDTGSAIKGAVRADYFAGSGPEAGAFAGAIKQKLNLWALWPRE